MAEGVRRVETDDVFEGLTGPHLATFTGRIPFLLGVPDDLGHTISSSHPFVDPDAARVFGSRPIVNIRGFAQRTAGIATRAAGASGALRHFYNRDFPSGTAERFAETELASYEQWVTLETPAALAADEDPADDAYTFHRCLACFNIFIRSVMVATQDPRLRPVVQHDFAPAVTIGALMLDSGTWHHITDLMLFPDFPHQQDMLEKPRFTEAEFVSGLRRIQHQAPFIRALFWQARVEDAMRRTGDAAGAIVGLQTAAEALLFDTYRMLLVDEERTKDEIDAELAAEPTFSTLVKTLLKDRLGGQWDPTSSSTPVGRYWTTLYQLRNDVVHRGFEAHMGHAEQAKVVYEDLVGFVADRLRSRCRRYPRTLLALLGEDALRDRGWLSASMRSFVIGLRAEPGYFFQPWDQAGRAAPA